jgi:hypothetical protein
MNAMGADILRRKPGSQELSAENSLSTSWIPGFLLKMSLSFSACVHPVEIGNLGLKFVPARVVELADTTVLEAVAVRRAGSSPVLGTMHRNAMRALRSSQSKESRPLQLRLSSLEFPAMLGKSCASPGSKG